MYTQISMKNLIIYIGLFLGCALINYAQDYPCNCSDSKSMEKYFEEKLTAKKFIFLQSGGSGQYFNDWLSGDIILYDSTVVKNKNLRYRGFGDQLLWARNSDFQMGIVDRDIVGGFVLYNEDNTIFAKFKNLNISNENDKNDNFLYLQVLAEGEVSFYVYRRIRMESTGNEMYPDYIYYMNVKGKYVQVKLSQSTLSKLVPEDKATIKTIIKKNKLRTRKEEGMIKAVELYNTRANIK